MEDIDEIRSKPADNNKNNINGKFTEHATETESKEKKKKKKNKEEEKSKKKKHKKKDDEKILNSIQSKEKNCKNNDIDLWLEDVNAENVENDTLNDGVERLPSKSKKEKKKNRKHGKDKKRDRSLEGVQTKSPKMQCLIDANGVKLSCFLLAVDDNENHNVKATFSCENTQAEITLNDVEINLEGGQQVSVVGSNPMKTQISPLSIQKEHLLLKVIYEAGLMIPLLYAATVGCFCTVYD